LTYSFDYGLAW